MNMNSVLSSLREALLVRGFRVVESRIDIVIRCQNGSSDWSGFFLRFDGSGGFDNISNAYRVIRDISLREISPAAWIRGKGPYILKRVMLMSLLAKAEGVNLRPVFELDLRRPADDMLAIISGSPDFMAEFLSEGGGDTAFGYNTAKMPYRRRKSPKFSVARNGGVRD